MSSVQFIVLPQSSIYVNEKKEKKIIQPRHPVQLYIFTPLISLYARCHQVSIEGDIDIYIITINGIFSLPLVESDPDLIIQSQIQHDTLALHDGPLAGLSIKNHLLFIVVHQVEVGLLKVPCMDVDVEEVDPGHIAVELAFEHVEVLMEINKDSVKHQRLVIVQAVQRFATPYGERRQRDLARVSRGTCLTLAAFGAHWSLVARRTIQTWFSRSAFVSPVTFITFEDGHIDDGSDFGHLIMSCSCWGF